LRLFWICVFFALISVGGWFIVTSSLRIHGEPIEVVIKYKAKQTSEQAFSAVTHGTGYNLKGTSVTDVQRQVANTFH
jgi:hypothetical protein